MDQALPNQFPDLGTLFQQMPAIGAMQAGTQQRIAEQNNRALQDAFRSEQDFLGQKRPLDLQTLVSQNRSRDASTNQTIEHTRGSKLGNDFTEQTQPGKVQAENATNKVKVGTAELQELDNMGQLFGQVSARMATAPPPMRAAIAKRMLGKYFPDNPELDNLLVTNADQLPTYFKDMADNVYRMGKTAREAQMREERELERERIRTEAQKEIAKITAGSRVEAAKTRQGGAGPASEAELVGKMSFDKQAGYYRRRAKEEMAKGNKEEAADYYAEADMAVEKFERARILSSQANQAGKVDIGAETGMATKPEVKPEGFSKPPAPEGKIRVQRPDGKTGFIPREQLQQAIKEGYKEVK